MKGGSWRVMKPAGKRGEGVAEILWIQELSIPALMILLPR